MNLIKLGALSSLAVISTAAMAQTFLVGATGGSALKVGTYNGTSYEQIDSSGSAAAASIVAVGLFVNGSAYDVIVRESSNSYHAWSFNNSGAKIQDRRVTAAFAGETGVGTSNFDGDSRLEFVVMDTAGRATAYEINGNTGALEEKISLGFVISGIFDKAVGIADADGDGDSDIVLQSSATNQIRFRYFQGATRLGVSDVVTDGSSQVVAPNGVVVGASNEGGGFQIHIKAANGAFRVWTMVGSIRASNFQTGGWNANWSMKV